MNASTLMKSLQNIIAASGDLEVDISVMKHEVKGQQYLVSGAKFVVVDEYSEEDGGPKICIRDWPY